MSFELFIEKRAPSSVPIRTKFNPPQAIHNLRKIVQKYAMDRRCVLGVSVLLEDVDEWPLGYIEYL
jgi:hypothetical protein